MSFGQIAAAVAAVLVAAFVVWRWRRLAGERKLVGIGVVIALGVYASGVLSALPDPKAIIVDVAEALGRWTYALVGVMAFLETGAFVGLVAPGETVVIAGGVIAGEGTISLLPLIGLVWLCAVLGDSVSFLIGRLRHGQVETQKLAGVTLHRHHGQPNLSVRPYGRTCDAGAAPPWSSIAVGTVTFAKRCFGGLAAVCLGFPEGRPWRRPA
jgi:hypothetical protein